MPGAAWDSGFSHFSRSNAGTHPEVSYAYFASPPSSTNYPTSFSRNPVAIQRYVISENDSMSLNTELLP
jgi:hypothetical protein